MKKYRVALIGVGNISQAHHKMLTAIPDRCEIVGMFDTRPEAMEKRHGQWGVPVFDSREALLAEKPDVVWIMTHSVPRPEILEACYAAGCDCFTEKPLSLNRSYP